MYFILILDYVKKLKQDYVGSRAVHFLNSASVEFGQITGSSFVKQGMKIGFSHSQKKVSAEKTAPLSRY